MIKQPLWLNKPPTAGNKTGDFPTLSFPRALAAEEKALSDFGHSPGNVSRLLLLRR